MPERPVWKTIAYAVAVLAILLGFVAVSQMIQTSAGPEPEGSHLP